MGVAFLLAFSLLLTLFVLSWSFGRYLVCVMEGPLPETLLYRFFAPVEKMFQKTPSRIFSFEMSYKEYGLALLAFHCMALLLSYGMLRLQPQIVSFFVSENAVSLSPALSLNFASSFVTNTDWQCCPPESVLHPFSQLLFVAPQMFLSAAVGLSVFFAVLRGIASEHGLVGNFFKDMVRSLLYVLLPLVVLGSILLVFLGTEMGCNFRNGEERSLPLAFFESIKMLGTNGGGYFDGNSMNIRENPTLWTTLCQFGYMVLLPMASLRLLSEKLGNKRYGWRVGILFCFILALLTACMEYTESSTHSLWHLDQSHSALEGKAVRVGSFFSNLWTTSTTSTACGATVCDISELKPLSKIIPLACMHTGEALFGAVGLGTVTLLFMQIVALFSAGLLVGRTPEIFGKKIDAGAMKLSILAVLLPVVLIYVALWYQISFGLHDLPLSPSQAMTPLIYSMTSTAVGNGSAFSGIDYTAPSLSLMHSFLMLVGRIVPLILGLLLGEHMSAMKIHPQSAGSLRCESWTSVVWLGFVILSSSLLFFCSLWIIGPLIEAYERI